LETNVSFTPHTSFQAQLRSLTRVWGQNTHGNVASFSDGVETPTTALY
jgi:hypothetical protein